MSDEEFFGGKISGEVPLSEFVKFYNDSCEDVHLWENVHLWEDGTYPVQRCLDAMKKFISSKTITPTE